MSPADQDLVTRLHAVAEGFTMPPAALEDDLRRGRLRVRRNRGRWAVAAGAAVAVVLGAAVAIGDQGRPGSDEGEPVTPPHPVAVGEGVVWYDVDGLHRGNDVEPTPVEVGDPEGDRMVGALALVRSGALYGDRATGDVWFHPWGGRPRVVGHDSADGPGGDPDGDLAVWFEGTDLADGGSSELVVYDTRAGREVARAEQPSSVTALTGDHNPSGNTFLEVSPERVVWQAPLGTYRYDMTEGRTATVPNRRSRFLVDVHDRLQVLGDRSADWSLVMRTPGVRDARYGRLEARARLSPTGEYLLAVEYTKRRHGAVIVDTGTGGMWRVGGDVYPWIAWAYDNTALVEVGGALLACDAATRVCERVPARVPFLMPTS